MLRRCCCFVGEGGGGRVCDGCLGGGESGRMGECGRREGTVGRSREEEVCKRDQRGECAQASRPGLSGCLFVCLAVCVYFSRC